MWWFALILVSVIASPLDSHGGPRLRVAIPEPPARFLHDGAGVLSAEEARRIEGKLMALDSAQLQIGVAILPSLEGEPLEDVSLAIAEKWQPGDAERDDGVLIAVFIRERKVRIEIGYGLEGRIPDAVAGRIIRNDMAPEFRRGQYGLGLARAIASIETAAEGRVLPARKARSRRLGGWIPLIFMMFFILVAFDVMRRNSGLWMSRRGSGRYRTPGIWFGGGGGSRGGSFGGFSGRSFGGGSFGGGGASGGW